MLYMWLIISVIMIVIGLAGVLVPFLPGIPLAFLGVFVIALVTGFDVISPAVLYFLGTLALLSVVIDYAAGILGARLGKASLWGVLGAVVGTIIGIVTMGIIGIVIGPALGVLIFELIAKKNQKSALRAAKSTLATSLLGIATNAILAIIFAVTLILALIF